MRLLAWENGLVRECQTLLLNVSVQVASFDPWIWTPDPIVGYSIRSAYCLLAREVPHQFIAMSDVIWHKDILCLCSRDDYFEIDCPQGTICSKEVPFPKPLRSVSR